MNHLLRYKLRGVEGPGIEIGRGSYAIVNEYNFQGLSCVGKSVRKSFYESASASGRKAILERYETQCKLLSELRHPHIVQFLGIVFSEDTQIPVLLMERLHCTLAACIDRYGKLPDESSYAILRDVAVGLCYLHDHSPSPIIHCDLTANNVLLSPSMSAKIFDFSVAKILDLSPTRMTQTTRCPGTPFYMPPEILVARPVYTDKVDVFAYGNLIVHVFCGRWPIAGEVFRADPRDPSMMMPCTEVQRRYEYLKEIGSDHPLMGITKQCLSNNPATRPSISEVLRSVKKVLPQFHTSCESRVDLLLQITALNKRVESLSTAAGPTKPNKKVPMETHPLKFGENLGTGRFGDVWEGYVWNETIPVAIKTLKPGTISPSKFLQEAAPMKELRHMHLVPLYAICCTKQELIYIVSEFMKHGSVRDYIRGEARPSIKLPQLIDICAQVAAGMAYLEEKKYSHCNLTARNVLVGERLICKVGDFGLTRVISGGTMFPIKWTAPEAATEYKFSSKSDVWSYGIVIYEVITYGCSPYYELTNAQVLEKIQKGYRMSKPEKCPENLYAIMLECWKQDPSTRPTFHTLKKQMEEFFTTDDSGYQIVEHNV